MANLAVTINAFEQLGMSGPANKLRQVYTEVSRSAKNLHLRMNQDPLESRRRFEAQLDEAAARHRTRHSEA